MNAPVDHRCFACEPPLHASMWTTWLDATEDDLRTVLATDGFAPSVLRPASSVETRRFTGNELDASRTLWIALDPEIC